MALVNKVKARLDKVNDYQASARLKTDVSFIKIPVSNVKVYYKKPNKFKIKKDDGISVLPKGGVSVNMSSILAVENFAAVMVGAGNVGGVAVKIVKLIPLTEQPDLALTTLYIDEKNAVVRKAETVTKQNGTYNMELSYGKYLEWGLPDKVIFIFDTKTYKLPKGITLEVENGDRKAAEDKLKNKEGRVEITYNSYSVNKGVGDEVFR